VYQLRQEQCARHAMQSIGDEANDIVEAEGRQRDTLAPPWRIASSVRISGYARPTSLSP
jgi:hypothetical protein